MTRISLRPAAACSALAVFACTQAPAHDAAAAKPADSAVTTPAFVFAAGLPCDDEPSIREEALRSGKTLRERLHGLGFSPVTLDEHPTPNTLRDAVRSAASGRVLVAYSGHATLLDASDRVVAACPKCRGRCRSALCLDDHIKLPVDALIEAVPKTAALVAFLLDGCSIAHVDVRRAPAPVSVLSASSLSTKLALAGRTPFSDAIRRFPDDADLDCDHRLADWELFRGLVRQLPIGDYADPQPKLRRQVATEIALLDAPGGLGCWPEPKSREQAMPPGTTKYTCGSSERVRVEGLAATVPADSLAVPCEDDTGQCFRPVQDEACEAGRNGERCDVW